MDRPIERAHDETESDSSGAESSRLNRREAMRAALGGAVAGAVFVAPRVAGFTVAPNYAAAASCTSGNANLAFDSTKPTLCAVICWGNKNGNSAFACGCNNCICSDETQNLTLPGTNFSLRFDVGGTAGCFGCSKNGGYRYEINGIDPPFQQCTLNFGGSTNCNRPAAITANGNVPLTSWASGNMVCNTDNDNVTMNVTFACTCN